MQSVGGLNKVLECSDCKTSFTSASLLLKHFADHIIEQALESDISLGNDSANATPHKKSKLSLLQTKKKERKESILEAVLRQSAVGLSEKLPPHNILQNDIISYSNTSSSDSFKSSSSQNCASKNSGVAYCEKMEEIACSDDLVVEIRQRAEEKHKCINDIALVKFDLQKRLENCVTRLSLKQGHKEIDLSKTSTVSCKQVKAISTIAQSVENELCKKYDDDDINPLKFCVVSLEGMEMEEAGTMLTNTTKRQNISKPLKGASNRKQFMPKKIYRPKEDMASIEVLKTDILSLSDNKMCPKSSTKRKYMCHVCSKSFGWSTDLKRHILTHTGERPFKCQMCDATFTRNFLLQKHESRVHSVDNVDKFTQDEVRESVKSTGNNISNNNNNNNNNNNEEETEGCERQIVLSGKGQQNKVWKSNRVLCNKVKNSFTISLDNMNETCDKYGPAKRKLQCEESSFDHFPQNVFNIL